MGYSELAEEKKAKLQEIAKKLGVSIDNLLKKGNPETIIEEYERGSFTLLND